MIRTIRSSWQATYLVRLARFVVFISCFIVYQLGAGISGQGLQKVQPPTTLQYEVSVTLKLVPVFVTDKQGKPVRDLNALDFEIYDNGQLKNITAFEKHFLAVTEKKAEQQKTAEPQNQAMPTAPQLPKLNRKFFFVLDYQQNDGLGFLQTRKAALHFMDTQIQPTDEVGVLSYQVRIGLKMHQYLSTDHQKVRQAIENVKGIPGTGQEAITGGIEEEDITAILQELQLPAFNPSADEATMWRMNYVAIMTELAKTLKYIPGNKNIIFFSAGYARSTLARDTMFQKNFEDMAKEFGSSSSPVYTINTMGSRAHFIPIDDRGDQSLQDLAAFSGGQYFEDVAHTEKNETGIQNATGNYYVLGYSINEKWDGQFHEIKVKVRREGCIASAQSGYYSPKPFTEFSEFEKDLHLMDLAFNDNPQFQSPITMPFVVLPCRDASGPHLVFMAALLPESLQEVLRQQTELVYVVTGQDGNTLEFKRGNLQLPDISKKQVIYYGLLSSPPGAYDCAIVLRNLMTGKAARARGAATVAEPKTVGLHLDPPLLVIQATDNRDVVYVRLTKKENAAADDSANALRALYPFLSSRFVPVLDEIPHETSKILAVVRSMVFNVSNPQIEFSVSLAPSAGGEEIQISSAILDGKRQGTADVLLLECTFPELQPGTYSFKIIAMDKNSDAKAETSRTIRLI
jgi:VWFA-related protein